MNCPICNEFSKEVFEDTILNKYRIKYYQCPCCAVVHTEKPYWLEESYDDSITAIDTGIVSRNMNMAMETAYIFKCLKFDSERCLDFGGGYGLFTRMMRDLGYDFYWYDKYSPNLLARGYEWDESKCEKVALVTAFEAFEHFDKPCYEIEWMLQHTDSILFSTLLYDEKEGTTVPLSDWWYYVKETGQHIVFYCEHTLRYIAKKYGLNYIKISRELHLLTGRDVSWLKKYLLKQRFNLFKLLNWKLLGKRGKQIQDMNEQKKLYKKE